MQLYSVIKNDSPKGEKFACWKFEGEDFKSGSQLIVSETEEALFIKDGMIQNVFSGGKYTLSTNNYPFITENRNMFSLAVSSFNCKVYFIDKSHFLNTRWGTDTPIQVIDPIHQIATSIQARGSYTLKITDSKKFYIKFVGNNLNCITQEDIIKNRKSPILQSIKTLIAKNIKESTEELLGISYRQEEFAELMLPKISDALEDYGLGLVDFYVEALDIPLNDPARAQLEARRGKIAADIAEINRLGENWSKVQSRDILSGIANNPNGGLAGAGAGLGMGMATGAMFANMASSTMGNMNANSPQNYHASNKTDNSKIFCTKCGIAISKDSKFCPECGNKIEIQTRQCSCSASIPANSKFCPECGKQVQ